MAKKLVTISGPNEGLFTVTQSGYRNPYKLWVAVKCSGEVKTAEYQAVRWNDGESEGEAGPFTLSGETGEAYVWEFPNSETPEGHGRNEALVLFEVA